MSAMAINAIAPFVSNAIVTGVKANNTSKSQKGAFLLTPRSFSLTRVSSGFGVKAIEGEWNLRRKLLAVKFSSSNSQESTGELKTKSEFSGERENDGSNPPFLTILAGIIVFLLFAWAFSIGHILRSAETVETRFFERKTRSRAPMYCHSMAMSGGVFASISAPQSKPLLGRRHTLMNSFRPLGAAYNDRGLALMSSCPKPHSGFYPGLSLKLTRGKCRDPKEIKCVKAANSLPEWYRDRAEGIVSMVREVTPFEVLKWTATAATAIWATKLIVGILLNPYLWMYGSWAFVVWPRPAAAALGIATLFPAFKKLQGKATELEEIFLLASAITFIMVVPFAYFNGYIEGAILKLALIYFAFFLTGYYVRLFRYGNDLNRKQPQYGFKKQPWKTIRIPKIAQIGFLLGMVGGHLAAVYENSVIAVGGSRLRWIVFLLAMALQFHAIWYLDKYSDKTLDQPFAVVIYGPYRLLRHPIYASTMLFFAGYCMTLGAYRSLVFIGMLSFLYYEFKSRLEEESMVEIFGEVYVSYREKVKHKFIPFVY